ncbi:MAG: hypothetical protein P8P88_10570 [Polaribacter sp.]|jgi:hypothetical protein|nr:hypothetical protein [Polaribacter sp.]
MKSSKIEKIRWVLFFSGLIVSAIISFNNFSPISNLALLPLTYAFSMLMLKKSYANNMGLALVIIEIIKICRYFVLPILISQESLFEGVNIAPKHNEAAVLLMCYELIIVSAVMNFYARKVKLVASLQKIKKSNSITTLKSKIVASVKKYNTNKVTFLWYSFMLFGAYIIGTQPVLRSRLFNFQMSFANEFGLNSGVNSNLSGIARVFFLLGIITTFAFLVRLIHKLPISKIVKVLSQLVLCILLVSSLWTNEVGSVSRWNMMIAILLSIYVFLFYYPSSRKKIIIGGIVGVLFVIIAGSLLKTLSFGLDDYTVSDSTEMYFSSQYFDEYFQGVRSVSNCILVAETYDTMNVFEGVLKDWFFSFPLLIKMVGLSNLTIATEYYHILAVQYDLIMPTITMGLLRFGWLFAPLYSVIAVIVALYFDKKLKNEQNMLVKLFYIYIVFWFSLFMAISPNVIDPNIWAPFIGIWLLTLEKKILNPKKIHL